MSSRAKIGAATAVAVVRYVVVIVEKLWWMLIRFPSLSLGIHT
jgi:hypothetical protein